MNCFWLDRQTLPVIIFKQDFKSFLPFQQDLTKTILIT